MLKAGNPPVFVFENILIWCNTITFPTSHWHHLIALSNRILAGLARSLIMFSVHTRFLDRRTR